MHVKIADGKLLGVRLPWSPLLRLHPSGIFSTDTLSLHHLLLYANRNLFLGHIFSYFTVFSKFYIFSLLSQSFKYFHCFLEVLHIFTVFLKFHIFSLFSRSFTYFHCFLQAKIWALAFFLISLRNMFKQCSVCDARIQMHGPLWRKHESVEISWSTLELQSIILDVPLSCNQSFTLYMYSVLVAQGGFTKDNRFLSLNWENLCRKCNK
jgi:hypothetical protein